jgi:hypothetical protein
VAVDESAGRRAPAPPSLAANPQPIARSVPGRARSTRANVVVAAAVVAVLAGGALTALLVNGSKTEPQGRAALVVVTGPLFTGVETYSTVAPAQPPLPLPATPASGPVAVIRSHYDHIAAGEFGAAFNLFTRSYRSSVPNWVSIRAAAQPRIHVTGLTLVSGDGGTARVQVKLYARDSSPVAGSDTQCRRFEGVVVLKREEGAWRYSPADNPLHGFVLPDSNSNCPDRG